MKWEKHHNNLTEQSLKLLLDNRIPYIRLSNFISENEIKTLLEQLNALGFEYYKNVSPPIGKIGETVFENQNTPDFYFEKGKLIKERIQKFAPEHPKVMDKLKDIFYQNHSYKQGTKKVSEYFSGLIRIMKTGTLLHIDYAPFDAQNFSVKNISSQIACNVFLKMPIKGGELLIYNKQWILDDEKSKIINSYGYDQLTVQDVEFVKIQPKTGDFILFNSRNFHQVLPNKQTQEDRITLSCFFGNDKNNEEIFFWS